MILSSDCRVGEQVLGLADVYIIYNFQFLIFNKLTMIQKPNIYDLEERTAKLGEAVILFCKRVKLDPIITPLINQLVRSATSVGANYMEANGASSRKDFQNKIFICKKEAQETKHWLRMISIHSPERKEEIQILWQETQELTLIFQKITTSLREKFLKNESLKIQ